MNIHWEADKYKENFSFVHKYGEDVLTLLEKAATNARAVDLGCGNGALTEKLAQMGFSVLGIDDSEEMLRLAQTLHPQLSFRKGNAVNFSLPEKADLIFSNAVFHWIDAREQARLAQNIFAQLKPGGQLACEFGGSGCAECVHSALERAFARRGRIYPRTFYFPTIGEYAPLLERAGFRVKEAYLFDRPTPQNGGANGLSNWIEMFVKKPFEGIDAAEKNSILQEAEQELRSSLYANDTWFIDYVRIRIKAVKPA